MTYPTISEVLTAHVMDDSFRRLMLSTSENISFSCVIYGGRLYDFDFYCQSVIGNFDAGVTALPRERKGDLLPILLSLYMKQHPGLRLFANEYVDLDEPFPSCANTNVSDLSSFINHTASIPLNLLVARDGEYKDIRDAIIAVAEISDGDAWLFVCCDP
jgi:hypothetical protein